MIKKRICYFLSIILLLVSSNLYADKFTVPNSLVTAEWLNENLNTPSLIVLDTSVMSDFDDKGAIVISSGREPYKKENIPTARFADLTSDLVDTTSEYPYAVPSPEKFSNAMQALGVGDNTAVVLYAND